jgi:hypothetical protein
VYSSAIQMSRHTLKTMPPSQGCWSPTGAAEALWAGLRAIAPCSERSLDDEPRCLEEPAEQGWQHMQLRVCFVVDLKAVEFAADRAAEGEFFKKSRMSQADRIDHERVSVDSLVQYLKQKCGYQNVQARKEQDDPPDFWLSIDGKRFAVEETSIADEGTIERIARARKNGMKSGVIGSKWEGEAQDELAGLMQERVQKKREKLEKKGVPEQCRDIILLFYDAYNFGDAEDARIALQRVHGYDWFHSILWAGVDWLNPDTPDRIGFFLYTKEDRWKR